MSDTQYKSNFGEYISVYKPNPDGKIIKVGEILTIDGTCLKKLDETANSIIRLDYKSLYPGMNISMPTSDADETLIIETCDNVKAMRARYVTKAISYENSPRFTTR
jgi:hypothetical protein